MREEAWGRRDQEARHREESSLIIIQKSEGVKER